MNIIDIQDDLKNLPEQALMQEMQRPTGSAPQFLVLGELKRRKQMRDDYNRQQNSDMKTVAEEVVTAAGAPQEGIMQMARSLNPNTNMAQDTGLAQATPVTPTQAPQPQAPQMMSGGGIMKLQTGGTISAIAALKVNYPDLYQQYKNDPAALAQVAEAAQTSARTPEMTGLEQLETPRENDLLKRMLRDPTRGMIKDQQKRDAAEFGADYALDQRAQSLINQRQAELAGNEMLFAEGEPTEYLTGNVSAGFGGSAVPMPGPDQPLTGGLASLAAPERLADPAAIPATIDVDPRAVGDAGDFSNDPRRGAARPPAVPGMNDVLPDVSIANARADADRDDLLRYLRGEGRSSMPAIIDAIDRENMGEYGDFRTTSDRVIRDDLGGGHSPAYFPEGVASGPLNRRAQAYMQGDMYTPPEQIYDLGPRGRLKYEEAGGEEFAAVSDRLAREDAADARTKEDAFFAAEDARFDAQRAADAAIDRRISGDQPRDRAERVSDALSDIIGRGVDYFGAPRDRDPVLGPFGGAEGTPEAEAIIAQNLQDQQDAGATTIAEQATTTTPVATKDTGGAGFGSMDSRIAQMLSNRQKEAESDKWMALAQTGMALMASKNPTLGGALGEAGLAGIGALQKSKQGARAFETDMLKLQTSLDIAQQRARSSGLKGSNLTLNQMLSRGVDLLKEGNDMLESAQGNADVASVAQGLIEQGQMLINAAGGGKGSGTGEFTLSSAQT